MILDKALLLKCLGGAVALAGTGTTAVLGFSYLNTDSPESLIENSGLSCTFADNSNDCEITTFGNDKKINVKYKDGTTKAEGVGLSNISASGPKIKIQKNVAASEGYNQNLKLTIEGGDITLTNGATAGTTTITKLEEFETYEIVKELFGKYYLSRKSTALEGKSKALGLPAEDNACKLPTNGSTNCQLDEAKLKKINFDGKNGEITIESGGTPEITLTITKTTDTTTYSTEAYKFAFESNKDITISSSPAKYIKKNTNTEFKVKETTSTDGGAKTLSLEKAWSVLELAKKVGISTCDTTNKACTFQENAVLNLFISSNDKKEGVKITESNKQLKYEEDKENYNQGFKFYADEDITLTNGTGGSDSSEKKIEKKGDVSGSEVYYEIKEDGGTWYLTKKTNGGGN